MKRLFLIFLTTNIFAFVPNSFSTKYVQIFESKVGKGERKAEGIFEYMYPSNLRVDQVGPEKILYVSNKNKTWIYRPPFFDDEAPEVTVHKGQDKSLSSFFDILKSGLKTNANYKVVTKKNVAELSFNNQAKRATGLDGASLEFDKDMTFKSIKSISLAYTDGRKVRLNLKETKVDVKFKKNHFVFDIPKNAKIVKK